VIWLRKFPKFKIQIVFKKDEFIPIQRQAIKHQSELNKISSNKIINLVDINFRADDHILASISFHRLIFPLIIMECGTANKNKNQKPLVDDGNDDDDDDIITTTKEIATYVATHCYF
jgi:hypothetical protein